ARRGDLPYAEQGDRIRSALATLLAEKAALGVTDGRREAAPQSGAADATGRRVQTRYRSALLDAATCPTPSRATASGPRWRRSLPRRPLSA
ncbi:hypothetical protein CTI14_63505, partial [Methylobacterium radiotolerans]